MVLFFLLPRPSPCLSLEQEEVDPNDEAALAAFMAHPSDGSGEPRQMCLGDLIVSKLREKQREAGVSVLPR